MRKKQSGLTGYRHVGLTRDDKHVYRYNGRVVPGVSQIVASTFFPYSGVPKRVLEIASDRGTRAHAETVLSDTNQIDEAFPSEFDGYVSSWRWFVNEFKVTPLLIEPMLYSATKDYAGEPDRLMIVARDGTPRPAIIDVKATASEMREWRITTAGYMFLALECDWPNSDQFRRHYGNGVLRFCVRLDRKGGVPSVYNYTEFNTVDVAAFNNARALYGWKSQFAR